MKYENLKDATEICRQIENIEKLLSNTDSTSLEVAFKNSHYGLFKSIDLKYENDEVLKQIATDCRNKVAQHYRNKIESLKTELEKL